MFNKNKWKEPFYKDDLKSVLINGLIFAILGGFLAAAVDYLLSMFLGSIGFGLIFIAYLIGYRIRKSYSSYHVLYSLLAILFMILGLMVSHYGLYAIFGIVTRNYSYLYIVFTIPSFYLSFLLSPIQEIITFFNGFDVIYLLLGIINIIIYVLAFSICYRLSKGRN